MKPQTLFKTLLLHVLVSAVALSASTVVRAQNDFVRTNDSDSANRVWAYWEKGGHTGPYFSFNGGGNYHVKWGDRNGQSSYRNNFTTGTGWEIGRNGCTGYVPYIGFNAGILNLRGGGSLSIYGWFKNKNIGKPDTEYYIVQYKDVDGPGGHQGDDYFGSYGMDGSTYDVYHNYHSATPWDSNNPNTGISGNPNGWEQWISVRRSNVSQGVSYNIDVAGHFQRWLSLGWNGGQWHPENFFAEKLSTEAYNFGWSYESNGEINATIWPR